jgi:PhnB protein
MPSRLNPYLAFDGTAREAMEHYQQVFGGDLQVMRFGDTMPQGTPQDDKTMHAQLETPTGFTLMASDMPPGMAHQPGNAFAVSLSGDDEAELRGWWDALSDGGTIQMPLERQVWGDVFGMCTDRFGVPWMVNIAGSQT